MLYFSGIFLVGGSGFPIYWTGNNFAQDPPL